METIKVDQYCPEDLSTKAFKLLIKWKQIIEECYVADGEQSSEAKEFEYNERIKNKTGKNLLKRTTHTEKYSEKRENFESSKSNLLLTKSLNNK